MTTRRISKIFKSLPTIEGAGVHLKRAFGYWNRPVVMNTQEELKIAFDEYRHGTFVK